MSQRGMGDLMKKLHESESLDEPSKEILKNLIEENIAKNARIAELESEVTQMKIKVNQLERYQSKNCLIFRNLPFSSNGTYLSDVIDLIQNVLNVNIEPRFKSVQSVGQRIAIQSTTSYREVRLFWPKGKNLDQEGFATEL